MIKIKEIFISTKLKSRPRRTFEHFWHRLISRPVLLQEDTIIEIRVGEFKRLLGLAYETGVAETIENTETKTDGHKMFVELRQKFNSILESMKL